MQFSQSRLSSTDGIRSASIPLERLQRQFHLLVQRVLSESFKQLVDEITFVRKDDRHHFAHRADTPVLFCVRNATRNRTSQLLSLDHDSTEF